MGIKEVTMAIGFEKMTPHLPQPPQITWGSQKVSIMVKLEIMVILCMAILIANFIVYPNLQLGGIRLHPDLIIPMLPIKKLIITLTQMKVVLSFHPLRRHIRRQTLKTTLKDAYLSTYLNMYA